MSGRMSSGYECQAPPLSERALREGILSARRHEPGVCHACDELRRIDKLLPQVIVPRVVFPDRFTTGMTGL